MTKTTSKIKIKLNLSFHKQKKNKKKKKERIEQTWLSQEVATKKLALGLKQRLETESLGGCATYKYKVSRQPNFPINK